MASRPCDLVASRRNGTRVNEQERPGEQPAEVETALKRPLTDHPPGEQPEQVLHSMPADEGDETGRQACLVRLVPEAGARWQAHQPAAADGPRAEPLAQNGQACTRLAPRGDAGLDEQPVDLGRQRHLEVAAQRRTDRRRPQPVDREVGPEESDHAMSPTEAREEARLAVPGQSQDGWTQPLQPTLDLPIGDFRRLGFEPQVAGCRGEPAPERLIAMP